ncbi:MAG TPA: DUF4230 domain-containing protein [Longimicrobiales bacterium]|nr:DUF4230 domain-containing protein [Longimicrobiales bacterium]
MRRALILLAATAVLLLAGILVVLRLEPPAFTESQVRDALFTTIQREAPEAFLVTGRLDVTATTEVENTKVFLPGIVGLDLGTTRARVRVPGKVSYGFEVDSLRPEMFRLLEDGSIELRLPALAVYSVEPDLRRLEVETRRGWARMGTSEEQVERRALAIVQGAMRRQAVSHLRTSYQSRINTARALERLLTPALKGLGMEDPKFRFRLGDDIVVEPRG